MSRKTLDFDMKTRFTEYEAGKKRLNKLELSPAEYELAVKRLAETLGI